MSMVVLRDGEHLDRRLREADIVECSRAQAHSRPPIMRASRLIGLSHEDPNLLI